MSVTKYKAGDPWHEAVDLMLTVDCDGCLTTFVSPTLGLIAAAGDDAAVVADEAQLAGWHLIGMCGFRCPSCYAKMPTNQPMQRTGLKGIFSIVRRLWAGR